MCPTGTSPRPATSDFRQAFNVIDIDHDGRISGEDLRRFFSYKEDDEQMIKAMIEVADANKDGYVQYEEFERMLKEQRRRCEEMKNEDVCYSDGGVMEDVFRVIDQDGDGRLGFDDLRCYLGRVGLMVGDDEIMGMIRLGGGDVNDGVSYGEFLHILSFCDLVC